MACWVFCNRCFQPPRTTSCFSLTNCGHVFCDTCLGKGQGRKDECLICRAPCHLVLLSRQTGSDIQALFTRVDGLCARYSRELSQISGFQEKHRKRLLAFYRESIRRLEDSLRTVTVQIQRMQGTRSAQLWALGGVKSAASETTLAPSHTQAWALRLAGLLTKRGAWTWRQPHPCPGSLRWPPGLPGSPSSALPRTDAWAVCPTTAHRAPT
ncbi:probable E3 SUMO-protein ligase RNF212 [Erinaceus europaeus]|uniref:Probable E3 SUMO-protein ligase RNF212 n=1 Tax=Erinaceus europaeus TaxID=9365 RepID=A0ABM3X6G1_ERIEU|nr:probable E3 SUMO-protein ligase RNF212 [Erinaceus europaeus]